VLSVPGVFPAAAKGRFTSRFLRENYVDLTRPQTPATSYHRYLLSADVDHALAKGLEVHPDNRQFQTLPEDKEGTLSRPVNKKGRPFSWSFTALQAFENCARAYGEERYFCNVKFQENEAIRDGNRGHACAEDILNGVHPRDPVYLAEVGPYTKAMLNAKAKGAELLVEYEIVLAENMMPLTGKKAWFSKEAWFRGKLDATIIQPLPSGELKATIADWKFGKVKDNPDQLKIFASSLSVVRPDVSVFSPKFIFPKAQQVVGCQDITKEEIPNIWAGILQRVRRMEQAWETENFTASPSGLCKYKTGQCHSYDSCPYARGK
jgi:hypothetical protein